LAKTPPTFPVAPPVHVAVAVKVDAYDHDHVDDPEAVNAACPPELRLGPFRYLTN
jgi:hypothetical protein